ncbi:hypothetical protein CCYA_CCYA01G0167 [Cyanidiococcus yangmingshanensis]|nr:hypothetical protein CCYA_CCYA01G0167 [Cyanidiococcus yangmingshanensis]
MGRQVKRMPRTAGRGRTTTSGAASQNHRAHRLDAFPNHQLDLNEDLSESSSASLDPVEWFGSGDRQRSRLDGSSKSHRNGSGLTEVEDLELDSDSTGDSDVAYKKQDADSSRGQTPARQPRHAFGSERLLEDDAFSGSSASAYSDDADDSELLRTAQSHFEACEESASDEDSSAFDERPDGRRRSFYYDADTAMDEEALDAEALDEEEAEAIRLQKQQLARFRDLDYTGGFSISELETELKPASAKPAAPNTMNQTVSVSTGTSQDDDTALQEVLRSLTAALQELLDQVEPILQDQRDRPSDPLVDKDPMLSLMELKRQLLLNYGMNLAFYLALKAEGYSVREHPVIDRLMEIGVTLDKIRPFEEQIRIRMEALVRVEHNADAGHRARLSDLQSDTASVSVGKGASAGDVAERAANEYYEPPHLIAEMYEDERTRRKREREASREHAQQHRNRMEIQQLAEELSDRPEQVAPSATLTALRREDARLVRLAEARETYEEEHLVRLPESKQERRARRLAEATQGLTPVDSKTPASGLTDLLSIADRIVETSRKQAADAERTTPASTVPPVRRKERLPLDLPHESNDSKLDQALSARSGAARAHTLHPEHVSKDPDPRQIGQRRTSRPHGRDDLEQVDSSAVADEAALKLPTALYAAAEASVQDKRRARAARSLDAAVPAAHHEDILQENQPRRITEQIRRNRGLVPRRPRGAAYRNPRVKRRARYAQALVRRKGQVRAYDDRARATAAAGAYRGETSGINKRARRSVNLSL